MSWTTWIRQAPTLLKRPLRELRLMRNRGANAAFRDEVLSSQWLPPDGIRAMQWTRLKKLLRHAYDTTVYYRELFDEIGLRVDEIRSLDDYVSCVPILDKGPLQQRMEDLISSEWVDRCETHMTSGSTGRPTGYVHPSPCTAHTAMWALANDLCGLQGDERKLHFQGRDLPDGSDHVCDPKNNVHRYSFFHMSPERLETVLERIVEWKPGMIMGYTSLIVLVARALQERGCSNLGVKAVQTHSEKLHRPQRALVEHIYGGPVFEHYGTGEILHLGVECEAHAGIHLFTPLRFFEIEPINDRQPNTGELIVTDLYNYAMPFLRYRVGDVVTIDEEPCACGRCLPRVEIDGRTFDLVRLRDGTLVGPVYFSDLIDPKRVGRYMVHQRSYDRIDVHIVPGDRFTNAYGAYILGEIRKLGVADARLHLVGEIDDQVAGKLRMVRSDVSAGIVRASREAPLPELSAAAN